MLKKTILFCILSILIIFPAFAHLPQIINSQKEIKSIIDPEVSRAFYATLQGKPHVYHIQSGKDFLLYVSLLVPKSSNPGGRYSARIYKEDKLLAFLDSKSVTWEEMYEPYAGDYYYSGPEFKKPVKAGNYSIEVFSQDNLGKYVLAVGEKEVFGLNLKTAKAQNPQKGSQKQHKPRSILTYFDLLYRLD